MRLIGLNGRKRSGKDTAFQIIREFSPGNVERRGFADKMKLSGVRALGFAPATIEEAVELADEIKESGYVYVAVAWNEVEVKFMTGREFWQRYGTEAHRDVYGFDFHVDALLPKPKLNHNQKALQAAFPNIDTLCITDVRFPNEGERILALGGEVWWIDADERLGPLPSDAHASEQPLPPLLVSRRVPNNDSLEEFKFRVQIALSQGVPVAL